MQWTVFFVILYHFLLLPPYQTPGDIIILHKYNINDNHMMYSFLRHEAQQTEFFVIFGPFFALLPPLTIWKITFLKKWKKCLKISSFYTSAPKIMIICYAVPEIWRVTDVIFFFILGHFLTFYPLTAPKTQN